MANLNTHTHIDLCMPVKNITVRADVYDKLSQIKRDGESFSDVIERLLEKKSRLSVFAGALAGSTEIETIREDVKRVRSVTVVRK